MIVRPRPGLLHLFLIWRGSVIPHILPELVLVAAISSAVTAVAVWRPDCLPAIPAAAYALLGLAFSIFLGFRNGSCYDRWWEARRQWGQLVTEQRSLARDSVVLPPERRQRLLRRSLAFARALAVQLRGGDAAAAAAATHLAAAEAAALVARRNPADAILRRQGEELAAALQAREIDAIVYQGLADRLGAMAGIQAASERIRHTPLPFAYTLLLHRTAHLFCWLLPLGVAATAGWATPFIAVVVAYTFFGLDALGDQLEEPFGVQDNDLPLDALVRIMEIDLLDALGEPDLPAALVPHRYQLT